MLVPDAEIVLMDGDDEPLWFENVTMQIRCRRLIGRR